MVLAYAVVCFVGYTVSYWAAPYAERTFGFDKVELGWLIGAPAALGGFLGVIGGGWLADRLHRRHPAGRLMVMAIGLAAPVPIVWIGYSTADPTAVPGLRLPGPDGRPRPRSALGGREPGAGPAADARHRRPRSSSSARR